MDHLAYVSIPKRDIHGNPTGKMTKPERRAIIDGKAYRIDWVMPWNLQDGSVVCETKEDAETLNAIDNSATEGFGGFHGVYEVGMKKYKSVPLEMPSLEEALARRQRELNEAFKPKGTK